MACPAILRVGGETKSDPERGICRGKPGKSRQVEKSALIARATVAFHKSAVALSGWAPHHRKEIWQGELIATAWAPLRRQKPPKSKNCACAGASSQTLNPIAAAAARFLANP